MSALLRAELLKLRTTRTFVALVGAAVLLSLMLLVINALVTDRFDEDDLKAMFAGDFTPLFILLLGLFYPGSGADQLDWRPTRSPEVEAQNEEDDIDQMLEAANARRRKRGDAELTEAQMYARVHEERELQARMREDHGVHDTELEGLLATRNERRRAKGLPEMSLEELRRSLDVPNPRQQ